MREAEVAIFITRRGRSEVLIAHRSPSQGSYWHTIAGGIEAGETPLEAAARELAEETGLTGVELHTGGAVVEYAYALSGEPPDRAALYPEGLTEVRVHCFVADAPDDWEPSLDWEHDEHRWCDPREAAETLRWPETAEALQRLLARPYPEGAMSDIGLFPLPVVLVPTERIPLHIFEPRYKELVNECIELGEEFGLVLATGDGAVHEIGTRARVAQVAEVLDDGSLNIVVEGGERFRLLDLTSGRAFTTGIVEPVQDDDEPPLETDVERGLELFTELAEVSESVVDLPDPLSPVFDFEIAARVDFAVEAKQELLAMTSPRTRMTTLVGLLEVALEALRLELTLRERAGRNGKVAPLDPETDD